MSLGSEDDVTELPMDEKQVSKPVVKKRKLQSETDETVKPNNV